MRLFAKLFRRRPSPSAPASPVHVLPAPVVELVPRYSRRHVITIEQGEQTSLIYDGPDEARAANELRSFRDRPETFGTLRWTIDGAFRDQVRK